MRQGEENIMQRWSVLLFGVTSYGLFLATFLYLAGFVGGFLTPTRLDGPLTGSLGEALFVDALLILQFGLQHSVMARRGFKDWVTRLVPQPAERSLYVLASNVSLALFFWQWRPLGGVVWDVQSTVGQAACWGMFAVGWMTVLATTWLINHFDLFGLRQVWLYFRGRPCPNLPFVTPGPYKYIRHPLYVGWTIVFWATPTMTFAHLVFAAGMTAYMLIAIWFEERDLVLAHADYAQYRAKVPMLIPDLGKPRTVVARPAPAHGPVPATASEC
jgi:protein-S-isoprenylcysteine O-methyltransferase Ste14